MTRLGKGVNETGLLLEDRMKETVNAIKTFLKDAESYGAQSVYLMATSAVRDAKNAPEFIKRVKEETGLLVDVISGVKEAEVGFAGVLLGSGNLGHLEHQLVIDIGGGSTELIVGNINGIAFSHSLDIGAVRLTGMFVANDPITVVETNDIKAYIENEAKRVIDALKIFEFTRVTGIGGTATTFATIKHAVGVYTRETVHNLYVSLDQVSHINETLASKSVEERVQIVGLEAQRADIIYTGGLILEGILKGLNLDGFFVSDYDNLEGYIDYIEKSKKR